MTFVIIQAKNRLHGPVLKEFGVAKTFFNLVGAGWAEQWVEFPEEAQTANTSSSCATNRTPTFHEAGFPGLGRSFPARVALLYGGWGKEGHGDRLHIDHSRGNCDPLENEEEEESCRSVESDSHRQSRHGDQLRAASRDSIPNPPEDGYFLGLLRHCSRGPPSQQSDGIGGVADGGQSRKGSLVMCGLCFDSLFISSCSVLSVFPCLSPSFSFNASIDLRFASHTLLLYPAAGPLPDALAKKMSIFVCVL